MPGTVKKITEDIRAKALRRPLVPDVISETEIRGFALVVTSRRAFWALRYQPRGINPATGKRWGGGVRHELGDAFATSIAEARAAALAAKALVGQGRDPHREAMGARDSKVAERSVAIMTAAEGLDHFQRAMIARTEPSLWTRTQTVRYARKAVRLLNAENRAIGGVSTLMVRLMLDGFPNSQADKRLTFSGLDQFLTWCRRRGIIERNPLDDLDRDERPKPGPARRHVPTVETIRAVWAAVAAEPAHARDMIRFGLLVPLRRDEFANLRWSEVDLTKNTVTIAADRMKNGEPHTLPLSTAALAILQNQPRSGPLVFPTPLGKPYLNWLRLLKRIRRHIGEADSPREHHFSLHDLRRAFTTILVEAGHSPDALDQALAHKRSGVAGVYNLATLMPARRAALDAWARLVLNETPAGNIVPLHHVA